MIRVLLLIPTLDRSGAEKQLTLLATGLPREEFEVEVVALTRGGPFEAELRAAGIPVRILHKRGKFDPRTFWQLRQLLRERSPQILHTWLFAANAYGRLMARRAPTTKIVVSERCVDSWKSGWQLWLDRRLIAKTDALIANSQSVAEFYQQVGYAAERITVIPNGIAIPEERTLDKAAICRDLFHVPEQVRVIGYIGRLAAQKRVEDLLWALELMRCVRDDVYLVIAGDGPERERLERFAKDVRVEPYVRFLGKREDVADWLPALDVAWLASDFEGMSNSLMEALAAGVPVVASDIAPNRELVEHGRTGILVPVGDRAAFAQWTRTLLDDPELATRLAQEARARMQSEFSIAQMIARHADLYRRLVRPT